MENQFRLQDALERLQKLFPAALSGIATTGTSLWTDEGVEVGFLGGAIQRSGWTLLQERYEARLKTLREESPLMFESTKETIALQCRAFHDVMNEFDSARRRAVTRAVRRQTHDIRPVDLRDLPAVPVP